MSRSHHERKGLSTNAAVTNVSATVLTPILFEGGHPFLDKANAEQENAKGAFVSSRDAEKISATEFVVRPSSTYCFRGHRSIGRVRAVLPVGFASAASLAAIQRGLGADGEPASVIDRCAHIGATPACGFAVAKAQVCLFENDSIQFRVLRGVR